MLKLKKRDNNLPVVAIVGRPNVGKSSLFNCIMHRRIAIVHEESGVTRDRVSMPAHWKDYHFLLVDTGGLGIMRHQKKGDFFDLEIRKQLEASLENVDLVIIVANAQDGITTLDREVVKFMFEKGKNCLLACNKADDPSKVEEIQEFYQLGIEDVTAISCQHRFQINTLLDKVIAHLPKIEGIKENFNLHLSIVGRPNVGKSSLLNALLSEDRVIVSDIAGTTRDAVDVPFSYNDDGKMREGVLIDTAGVKRQGKIDNLVDMFSIMRTEDAIKRSSIILFVLDASSGVMNYDKKIGSLILKYGKPCLIIVNKWDLLRLKVKKEEFQNQIFNDLPFISYAPLVFASALESDGLEYILEEVLLINDQASIKIPTSLVNQVLQDMVQRNPPPSTGKGFFKIYYGLMAKQSPASFIIFCNRKNYLQKAYLSFIEKQLRRAFALTGIPIELHLKEREHLQNNYREENTIPKEIQQKLEMQRKQQRFRTKKYRK